MNSGKPRVTASFENPERNRCVDIVIHDDGHYGFAEWRREPEDPGNWYRMADDGGARFGTEAGAIAAAKQRVAWFAVTAPVAHPAR